MEIQGGDWLSKAAAIRRGLTMSGLDVDKIPELESAWGLEGYRYVFIDYFCRTFGTASADREMAIALESVHKFKSVGDFLAEPKEQLAALAAFGLVLIDELARHAVNGGSGWDALHVYDGIAECAQYVQHHQLALLMPAADSSEIARQLISRASQRAAHLRHGKTNTARTFVVHEWLAHKAAYAGNKSAFARDYVRRVLNEFDVRITEKTVREVWLADTPDAGIQAGLQADGE